MNEEFLTGLGIDGEVSAKIIEEYEKEKLVADIRSRLEKQGAVDTEAAFSLLDKDGISTENAGERIERLKNEHSALFHKKQVPKFVTEAQVLSKDSADEFSKMSYRQRLELFMKNPEAYKELMKK